MIFLAHRCTSDIQVRVTAAEMLTNPWFWIRFEKKGLRSRCRVSRRFTSPLTVFACGSMSRLKISGARRFELQESISKKLTHSESSLSPFNINLNAGFQIFELMDENVLIASADPLKVLGISLDLGVLIRRASC
jgi:hypothetical protein